MNLTNRSVISYTQIPIWFIVMIALIIGISWECVDVWKRYSYEQGTKKRQNPIFHATAAFFRVRISFFC